MDQQRTVKWHIVELIGIAATALIAPALVVGCIVVDDLMAPADIVPTARAATITVEGVTKRPEACKTPPAPPAVFFYS